MKLSNMADYSLKTIRWIAATNPACHTLPFTLV